MLKEWKKRYTLGNVEGSFSRFLFIFCLFSDIFFGEIVLFCPEVFGKVSEKVSFESVFGLAKFESLARILNSSKLVKNISGSDPIVPAGKSISTDPFVMVAGIRYLTLNDIVKSLKCSVLSDNGKGFAKITKGGATVQLTAGQDCILYQTSKIYLLHRLKLNLKDILVSYDDYLKVLVPLLAINLIPGKAPALKTIVLDPGHGGKDPGAINAYLNLSEKTLALQIATSLKAELIKRGYVVTLTRETDTFVELVNRPAKAKDADLFMSLHLNSATNTSAQGVEIFTLKRAKNFSGNTFDSWNLIAAYSVLSAFGKTTSFTNRGIKMAEFAVLKSLACPGILVELGFISNDVEAKKLLDINFQKKIIQGLADGVVKYGENLKKKR